MYAIRSYYAVITANQSCLGNNPVVSLFSAKSHHRELFGIVHIDICLHFIVAHGFYGIKEAIKYRFIWTAIEKTAHGFFIRGLHGSKANGFITLEGFGMGNMCRIQMGGTADKNLVGIENIFFPGLFNQILPRITSYNVCYTKLLRLCGYCLLYVPGLIWRQAIYNPKQNWIQQFLTSLGSDRIIRFWFYSWQTRLFSRPTLVLFGTNYAVDFTISNFSTIRVLNSLI